MSGNDRKQYFISTRDNNRMVQFDQAVLEGLSPEGGLYHFAEMPDLSALIGGLDPQEGFAAMSARLITALFPDLFDRTKAEETARTAFPFSPVLTKMEDGIDCLELFHGPTCAFKDFGASFLAASMEEFLLEKKSRAVILTATSGDTGSAVAQAFFKKHNIDVVILYPQNRVSLFQEKQLTTLGENIHALEIKGSFDDCQRMVKEAFTDNVLKTRFFLTSANSINLGRLIPQAFYYIWAFTQLKNSAGKIAFCVPSGNFGNLTAGLYAAQWGLPVDFFIAATNVNDVVPEYLISGDYRPRRSVQTLSNAMDVGNPSNFERMLALYHNDHEAMKKDITEHVVSDETTRMRMKQFYAATGRFIDPHTAVGYDACRKYLDMHSGYNGRLVCLSTAHPGKFPDIVRQATGAEVTLPEQLKRLLTLKKTSTVVDNKLEDLSRFLEHAFPEL